ncbi:MAG: hypothetical protein V7711_18675 [Pseudomonadales bacterium]
MQAANKPGVEVMQLGGIEIVSRSAAVQLVVFQTPDDVEKFCLSPAPDVVNMYSEGVSVGVSGYEVGEQQGDGAMSMGGRSPAVLLAREFIYRACEFSLNYHLSKSEAIALYKVTLDHIVTIVQADTAAGASAIASAPDTVALTLSASSDDDDDDTATEDDTELDEGE